MFLYYRYGATMTDQLHTIDVMRISVVHTSVMVLLDSKDGFILSSTSSSAATFMHTISTTLD
jgi:hypothetical protein